MAGYRLYNDSLRIVDFICKSIKNSDSKVLPTEMYVDKSYFL